MRSPRSRQLVPTLGHPRPATLSTARSAAQSGPARRPRPPGSGSRAGWTSGCLSL